MLLSLEKRKTHTDTHKKTTTNKQKQQQHVIAPVYITGGDAIK